MGDYFVGEIRAFSFDFAPAGWAQCDGSILQIATHAALFALIGTYYGGDGQQTFALPDLRGRVPQSFNPASGGQVGNKGGAESVILTATQLPPHSHAFQISTLPSNANGIAGNVFAATSNNTNYYTNTAPNPSNTVPIVSSTLSSIGGGAAHNNMQPFLAINFCICLNGIFPTRS